LPLGGGTGTLEATVIGYHRFSPTVEKKAEKQKRREMKSEGGERKRKKNEERVGIGT